MTNYRDGSIYYTSKKGCVATYLMFGGILGYTAYLVSTKLMKEVKSINTFTLAKDEDIIAEAVEDEDQSINNFSFYVAHENYYFGCNDTKLFMRIFGDQFTPLSPQIKLNCTDDKPGWGGESYYEITDKSIQDKYAKALF